MTDEPAEILDPDSAEHARERQALDYEPEVLAEPIGGPVPEHEPVDETD